VKPIERRRGGMLIEIESVLCPWLPWSGMDCIRDVRRSNVPLLRRSAGR
jgi:hypothetical protein